MRYAIAALLPPLGLLTVGKPGQAVLNLLLALTCVGWPIASVWALLAVLEHGMQKDKGRVPRA